MSGQAGAQRVLFVAGTLAMGGAERQLVYMLEAMRTLAPEVTTTLVALADGGEWVGPIREMGVPLHIIPRGGARLSRMIAVARVARRVGAQVVQCQHFYTNLYGVLAARLSGSREIGAIRSDGRSEMRANPGLLGRLQLRTPRLLAVNSRPAIAHLRECGVPDHRLYWLPNVVDTQRFYPPAQRRSGPVRILGVGRHSAEKRWDRFLRVLAELKVRFGSRVEAELVGDGPERPATEALAGRLNLGPGQVRFRGASTDVAPLYREADIFLHTSDWEGTPNVILEAMASGLPIVATRVGGVEDLVREGKAGEVADAGDESGLVRALAGMVEDEEKRARYGASAQQYIHTHHARPLLPTILRALHTRALGQADRTLSPGSITER